MAEPALKLTPEQQQQAAISIKKKKKNPQKKGQVIQFPQQKTKQGLQDEQYIPTSEGATPETGQPSQSQDEGQQKNWSQDLKDEQRQQNKPTKRGTGAGRAEKAESDVAKQRTKAKETEAEREDLKLDQPEQKEDNKKDKDSSSDTDKPQKPSSEKKQPQGQEKEKGGGKSDSTTKKPEEKKDEKVKEGKEDQTKKELQQEQRQKKKQTKEKKPKKGIKDKAKEQVANYGKQLTSKLLKMSWLAVINVETVVSVIIGLAYLNVHLVAKYFGSFAFFCDFGEEWTYEAAKASGQEEQAKQLSIGLRYGEIIFVIVIDLLILALLGIIIYVIYFLVTSNLLIRAWLWWKYG